MKRGCLILLIALLVVLCTVIAVVGLILLATPASRPLVLINLPRNGERIAVGQDTLIQAIARDEQKIRRVELWVDGALRDAQTSNVPGGISPFPLITNWSPVTAGAHTLVVRAYNMRGGHGQASISIDATQAADRDNDGVPDATDACPDQPGPAAAQGCPDRDGDGIRDSEDACPDQPGLPAARGCPSPSANDRDGDGVVDSADACPDQPGSPFAQGCPDADNDGTRDSADACPREPGPPERNGCPVPGDADADGVPDASDACPRDAGPASTRGCPDSDGDGVADRDDACPDVPGAPGLGGCPDRDGDGVRDLTDLCPDVPGPASNAGCPPTGSGDSDGDGVDNGTDLAPSEPGSAESGGAPAPGSGEEEAPANPLDDLGSVAPGPRLAGVTFEALEFQLNEDYDEVYCYGGLGGAIGVVERFGPFRPLGSRRWDIAEYLGGANSRFVTLPADTPLQGFLECIGYVRRIIPGEGGEETAFNLGSIRINHPSGDWDGHEISQDSNGGTSGRSFRAGYRLCRGTCRNTDFPPPILHLYSIGGRRQFVWLWEGNRSNIDGFKLYVGNTRIRLRASQSSFWAPAYLQPPCGERYEFRMTAYRGDRESPFSNTAYWSSEPCPRRVRVTFQQLQTRELCCETSPVGPVTGVLWANGQQLNFDGSDLSYWGTFNGLWLESNQTYDIRNLLQIIARWQDSCLGRGCPSYSAPWDNSVTLSLGGNEDLTVGIRINDVDKFWGGVLFGGYNETVQTACEAQNTIPASQITSGTYRVTGSRCSMSIVIETLGP